MPTQATIAITPGSGQLLDAVSLVIGLNTVVRETMVIADSSNATNLAGVTAGGALKVDASATIQPISISGSVPVTQSTTPWVISFTAPQHVLVDSGNIIVTNSGTFTVQATLAAETTKVIGAVNQAAASSPWIVAGTLTHNNAAPSTKNIGVLPALANAATPTYTEGDQVLLSTDLTGALRVNATFTGSVSQNVAQWNSVALGSPSAYGTSPGAVNVIGVNAFVTSLPAVTIAAAQTIAVTNAGIFAVRVTGNIGGVFDAVLGAAIPANALLMGGSDGTNLHAISTDTTGVSLDRPAAPTTALWSQVAISFSASGVNILVAGVGGKTIRVMRMFFVNTDPTTSTNITIQDSTPTSFSGAFLLQSGGSFTGNPSGEPMYVTAVGKAFQLNSSAAVQVSGTVWYTIS